MNRIRNRQSQGIFKLLGHLSQQPGCLCVPLPKGQIRLRHRLASYFHHFASNGTVALLGRRIPLRDRGLFDTAQVVKHVIRRPFLSLLRSNTG
jgi:hypothetical protein